MDKPQDLSWFYFQRVVGQQLEVRSPGVIVFEIYLNMLVGSDQYCPPHNSIQHIELPTLLDGFLAAFLEEFAVLW
ncbi:MAG: hypothetical protein JWR60_3684 [Polaromonas sp.]|nr:hypothetical protein [Polaromonas sp.]